MDDDVWRRAFADSSGLFDSFSIGPLLSGVNGDGQATPPPVAASTAPADPISTPQPTSNVVIAPTPTLDFAASTPTQPPLLPGPTAFSAGGSPMPKQAQRPTQPTALRAGGIANRSGSLGLPRGARNSVVKVSVKSGAASASKAAISVAEPDEDAQDVPHQRAGESFARKRDRAKLLRQQMNDGLDSLHEALGEISTSGANPSAAATTSLIPTRGPRRATVVACSSGLVRDLISTCVALRAENASLTKRLAAGVAAAADAASQTNSSTPLADGRADQEEAGRASKKRDRVGQRVEGGLGAGRVFGQLLALGVFGFLGPQSLEEGRKVSREWRDKCTWDCCWKNLCVTRWRLCPEERHAEVWRVDKPSEALAVVTPPVPPPSWRQIYGRLQKDSRVPRGALSPVHLVIGKSVQEGLAIWIALSRRSNGMTGRSVLSPGSGLRTTEVIELRAVVQRVAEGPPVRVHPRAFTVRKVQGLHSSVVSDPSSSNLTTTRVFQPLPPSEERFAPRVSINTGAEGAPAAATTSDVFGAIGKTDASAAGGSRELMSLSLTATRPLTLYEYATVDFFVEAPGCPTEADFLRLDACVDVHVWDARVGGEVRVLPVALTHGSRAAGSVGRGAVLESGRPIKRRGGGANPS